MPTTLSILKNIIREEYEDLMDGINIHNDKFRDYESNDVSDFDEPHKTEKMESFELGSELSEDHCCDNCKNGEPCCSLEDGPVEEVAKRDYKAEYKKFQSSTKSKKYRAELNKYNRQKGTYGNGDGKDASHKGGKIVGFEDESKNRGRAEKSRLKKENVLRELIRQQLMKEDWWSDMSSYDQSKYIKDHPGSDKAKSVKKSQKDKEDNRKKLAKKDYEVDSTTGKAIKKKTTPKDSDDKKKKHMQAIEKGIFPGSPQYKKFMEEQKLREAIKNILQEGSGYDNANDFWRDMFEPGPIPTKYINQLIKKKGELPSKKHIIRIYKQNRNPNSKDLAKSWKDLVKEKYVTKSSGMWYWETNESINESTEFIVFYNRKQHKVKAKDLYTAKKEFISKNKIPKSKQGIVAVMSKKAYDDQQFRYESINEGKKKFRVNLHAIGKAKYSIVSHDGKSKHKDGSPFWGIDTFKNKKDLEKAIKDYTKKGYIKESINEATGKEKVFVQSGELWISRSTGSGSTTRIRGRGFISDKKGSKNYDSDAAQFAQWAKSNKAVKKQKQHNGSIMYLFKIPEYIRGIDSRDLSIWGGEVKPNKWIYLMVSAGKINVVTVFDSKQEALSWFKVSNKTDESINEANTSQIKKKLLKQFGKDPLYKDVIMAKNTKEMKKAMDTLKSIRGGNALVLMQKYAKKITGESINEAGKSETKTFKISGEVMKNTKVYYPGFNTTVKTPVVNYKIRNFQEPISKKMLLHIKKELGGDYLLKTNAGVELHSKELRNNTWKGIKVLRMESINEATEYYKSKKKNEDLYYKKVGNKWYKSMASKKGKVKWYTVKFPQDLDMRDMDKLNKSKIPSELVESKLNEAKESPIDVAKRIVKNRQSEKVDGVLLDMLTANLIVQVYDAVSPKNKRGMMKLPIKKMADVVWKLAGR